MNIRIVNSSEISGCPIGSFDATHYPAVGGCKCPVLDAAGNPVPVPAGMAAGRELRQFMAGRLPAPACGHYMAAQEVRAGFTTCERCPSGERP